MAKVLWSVRSRWRLLWTNTPHYSTQGKLSMPSVTCMLCSPLAWLCCVCGGVPLRAVYFCLDMLDWCVVPYHIILCYVCDASHLTLRLPPLVPISSTIYLAVRQFWVRSLSLGVTTSPSQLPSTGDNEWKDTARYFLGLARPENCGEPSVKFLYHFYLREE